MNKPGRNDPCPCGSGKKYKQCCLKTADIQTSGDRSEAVPKALQWLMDQHGQAVREAIDEDFLGGLDPDELETLRDRNRDLFDGIMANALEWLLADGFITVKGQERRVSELLLGRGGPLLSAEQRQWLERMVAGPLGLYEVIEVTPGESLRLRDAVFPERTPILVREKTASRQMVPFDLIGARIVPIEDHFLLSGVMYSISRQRGMELIAELRHELEGVAPDSPDAKEILGTIIPSHWLESAVAPFEISQLVDQSTGDPILLITDHYRVGDWEALDRALAAETDVEGNRKDGWSRLVEGEDGLSRPRVTIDPAPQPDRIKVFYRTQRLADVGRPWFEGVAGQAVVFISREISDPKSLFARPRSSKAPAPSPPAEIPPEAMTKIIETSIRRLYANWADQPLPVLGDRTPRQAIETPEGLEQVKYLLRTYEHGEMRQAKAQNRAPVSYDFLWRQLGLKP